MIRYTQCDDTLCHFCFMTCLPVGSPSAASSALMLSIVRRPEATDSASYVHSQSSASNPPNYYVMQEKKMGGALGTLTKVSTTIGTQQPRWHNMFCVAYQLACHKYSCACSISTSMTTALPVASSDRACRRCVSSTLEIVTRTVMFTGLKTLAMACMCVVCMPIYTFKRVSCDSRPRISTCSIRAFLSSIYSCEARNSSLMVITTVGAGVGVGDGAVVAIDEVEVLANGSLHPYKHAFMT